MTFWARGGAAVAVRDPISGEMKRMCARCGNGILRRSKARNLYERLRRDLLQKKLYRCDSCDWRGWLPVLEAMAGALEVPPDPDLAALDASLDGGGPARGPGASPPARASKRSRARKRSRS